jgi:hypothetical protein
LIRRCRAWAVLLYNVSVDPRPAAAQRRVTVVEDENAMLLVPRLLLKGSGPPGPAEMVTWELRYGGLPIATGSLGSDREVLFTDTAAVQPSMDSSGLSFTARYEDGRLAAIEAICVRPGRPVTRAEATAREKWPGARHQQEAPALRRPLLAGTRAASLPVSAGPESASTESASTESTSAESTNTATRARGQRCVYVYQHFSALLARRRRYLREPASTPRQTSPDRES